MDEAWALAAVGATLPAIAGLYAPGGAGAAPCGSESDTNSHGAVFKGDSSDDEQAGEPPAFPHPYRMEEGGYMDDEAVVTQLYKGKDHSSTIFDYLWAEIGVEDLNEVDQGVALACFAHAVRCTSGVLKCDRFKLRVPSDLKARLKKLANMPVAPAGLGLQHKPDMLRIKNAVGKLSLHVYRYVAGFGGEMPREAHVSLIVKALQSLASHAPATPGEPSCVVLELLYSGGMAVLWSWAAQGARSVAVGNDYCGAATQAKYDEDPSWLLARAVPWLAAAWLAGWVPSLQALAHLLIAAWYPDNDLMYLSVVRLVLAGMLDSGYDGEDGGIGVSALAPAAPAVMTRAPAHPSYATAPLPAPPVATRAGAGARVIRAPPIVAGSTRAPPAAVAAAVPQSTPAAVLPSGASDLEAAERDEGSEDEADAEDAEGVWDGGDFEGPGELSGLLEDREVDGADAYARNSAHEAGGGGDDDCEPGSGFPNEDGESGGDGEADIEDDDDGGFVRGGHHAVDSRGSRS